MEQVGTVKKYRDGEWYIWVEIDDPLQSNIPRQRINVYLQRENYFNIEYVTSIFAVGQCDLDRIIADIPGMEQISFAKRQYKAEWLDDDEEI